MPSFLVCSEVHPLPESPPEGDLERRVLVCVEMPDPDPEVGGWELWTSITRARLVPHTEDAVWWSELPVLPAPGDRLTTEDVGELCDRILLDQRPQLTDYVNAARLRAGVGIEP